MLLSRVPFLLAAAHALVAPYFSSLASADEQLQAPSLQMQQVDEHYAEVDTLVKERETVSALTVEPVKVDSETWVRAQAHAEFPAHSLRVREPRGYCDPSVNQTSGYLDVDDEKHFFFHFFESRSDPKNDPLVLWLNGGPGCSSMTGLYMENGPCRVKVDGSGLDYNEHGWNDKANIIFLDQPLGAGFSYGKGGAWDTDAAAKDVYAFLQLFFHNYPQYAKLPFHIWGESYAGHYIPGFANHFVSRNKNAEVDGLLKVNVQSVGIGNGVTDPIIQNKYAEAMACGRGGYPAVLSEERCKEMRDAYPTCRALMDICYASPHNFLACVPSEYYCNKKLFGPYVESGRNVYDIREKGEYEILEGMRVWLGRDDVKRTLGTEERDFGGCSTSVMMKFLFRGDQSSPYTEDVKDLLANGVRVLIYAGDKDWICNWLGNKAWLSRLDWDGQLDFLSAKDLPWKVDGKDAGEVRSSGNLTFLRVFDAGHMVPYDQPKNSLDMLNRWNADKSFTTLLDEILN